MNSTSITCPRCGRTSYNLNDIVERYCGNCHWWTSDPQLAHLIDERQQLTDEVDIPIPDDVKGGRS